MDGSGVDKDLISNGSFIRGIRRMGYRAFSDEPTFFVWGWSTNLHDSELIVEYLLAFDERGEYLEFAGYQNQTVFA